MKEENQEEIGDDEWRGTGEEKTRRGRNEKGWNGDGPRKGEQVDEDVTGWVPVRRTRRAEEGRQDQSGESCKTVQIFVKVGPERSRWMWRRTTKSVTR